jgi:hypothetical protein
MTPEEEQRYEAEREMIERMYPDANFDICFTLNELDEVVSEKKVVIIKMTHNCYCYDDCPRQNEFIVVKNDGDGITTKMLVEALIRNDYDPECNHRFLELFEKVNDVTFTPFFGS